MVSEYYTLYPLNQIADPTPGEKWENPLWKKAVVFAGKVLALPLAAFILYTGCSSKSRPNAPDLEALANHPMIENTSSSKDYKTPPAIGASPDPDLSKYAPLKQDMESRLTNGESVESVLKYLYNTLFKPLNPNTPDYETGKAKYLAKKAGKLAQTSTEIVPGKSLPIGDFVPPYGQVDFEDFFRLAEMFGTTEEGSEGDSRIWDPRIDIAKTGASAKKVDFEDFFLYAEHFGEKHVKADDFSLARDSEGLAARVKNDGRVQTWYASSNGVETEASSRTEGEYTILMLGGKSGKIQLLGKGPLFLTGTDIIDTGQFQNAPLWIYNASSGGHTILKTGSTSSGHYVDYNGTRIVIPAAAAISINPEILPFLLGDLNQSRLVGDSGDVETLVRAFKGDRVSAALADLIKDGNLNSRDLEKFAEMAGSQQVRLEGIELKSGYEKPGMVYLLVPNVAGIDTINAVVKNHLKQVQASYSNGSLKPVADGKLLVPVDTGLNGEQVDYWVTGRGKTSNGKTLEAACDLGSAKILMTYAALDFPNGMPIRVRVDVNINNELTEYINLIVASDSKDITYQINHYNSSYPSGVNVTMRPEESPRRQWDGKTALDYIGLPKIWFVIGKNQFELRGTRNGNVKGIYLQERKN